MLIKTNYTQPVMLMFSGQWLMNYFIQTYHITMFILCDFMWFYVYNQKCDPIVIPGYPLVNKHSYWKMAIEIVDLPMKNIDSP